MKTDLTGTLSNWSVHGGDNEAVSCVRFFESMVEKHRAIFSRPRRPLPKPRETYRAVRAISKEELERMAALRRQGMGTSAIAAELGRSRAVVCARLKQLGLSFPHISAVRRAAAA